MTKPSADVPNNRSTITEKSSPSINIKTKYVATAAVREATALFNLSEKIRTITAIKNIEIRIWLASILINPVIFSNRKNLNYQII